MNIKALLFCVFMIAVCSCKKSNDALQHKTDTDDSLAFYFQEANLDTLPYKKRYAYAQKALDIVSKQPNDSMYRVNMFKVANRFWNMSAFEDYKTTVLKLIKKSEVINDSVSLAKTYIFMSDYYGNIYNSDSAYIFITKAEKTYRNLKDKDNIAKSLLNKASLQHNESDYSGCEKTVFQALQLLQGKNDNQLIYHLYNFLGLIYSELNEYELSHFYYSKTLEYAIGPNNIQLTNQSEATVLNNLGLLYQIQGKHQNAVIYFKKALKKEDLYRDRPEVYAMLIDNLAYSEFKLGNFKQLPQEFLKSLKIRDSFKIIPGIILNKIHLSEYYSFKKDTAKAFKYSKEAYTLANNKNLKKDQLLSLKQLSLIDPKNATKYSAEYYRIDDSLQLAERRMRNKFARIEYETEELEIEKDKLTSQRSLIIYISGGLILLLVSLLAIRSRRAKNRELKFARQQQESNEEIYRLVLDQQQKIEQGREAEKIRIAQELHDGVMGRLSSIRLNLFALEKKPDPETVAQCLPYIEQIQQVEKEIRTIAYDLELNLFSDSTSFPAVLADIIKSIKCHSDTDFEVNIDTKMNWETIDSTIKMELYRILQEALQNTDKHAKAKKVTITIAPVNDGIALTISDDGIGFDTTDTKKGLGLKSMTHRINKIGGVLQINSQPDKGTLIRLDVPVKEIIKTTN